MSRGKLIVIEGNDGSGKATQSGPLLDLITAKGKTAHLVHFPNYESEFGKTIKKILTNQVPGADPLTMSPHAFSAVYTLDRYLQKQELTSALNAGEWIVADRYETANELYQAVRFNTESEQDAYINWLRAFEFDTLGMPRPDLVLYLYVPVAVSQELVAKRGASDAYDKNSELQQKVQKQALKLCEREQNWKRIDCVTDSGTMRTREEIAASIAELIQHQLSNEL